MPITTAELIVYGAANRPDDDASLVGGAIDVTCRPFDAELVTPTGVEALSSGADTRTVTVYYRGNDGAPASGVITLNGVTPVELPVTAERLLRAVLSTTHGSNVVTLRTADGITVLHTFAPSETEAVRLFRNAVSATSPKVYYEKYFFKNTDDVSALLGAYLRGTADPTGKLAVAIANTVDDTGTSADRLTAPAGVGAFTEESIDLAVPGTNLAAGSAIGFWLRFSLAAGEVPLKSSVSYQLRGSNA